jgi:hypothetical protein
LLLLNFSNQFNGVISWFGASNLLGLLIFYLPILYELALFNNVQRLRDSLLAGINSEHERAMKKRLEIRLHNFDYFVLLAADGLIQIVLLDKRN